MTTPNHCRDSAGNIVHFVTESTVDAPVLWNPVVAYNTETIKGATAAGVGTAMTAYGVSLINSTISGTTGFYVLGAPVPGYDKSIFATAASSTTSPSQVWTNSTGVFIQSTGGATYRTISFGKDGGYCYLAAQSATKWAYLGGSADCVLGTT